MIGVGIFVGWNIIMLIGVFVGDVFGDLWIWGLDVVVVVVFLVFFWLWFC